MTIYDHHYKTQNPHRTSLGIPNTLKSTNLVPLVFFPPKAGAGEQQTNLGLGRQGNRQDYSSLGHEAKGQYPG